MAREIPFHLIPTRSTIGGNFKYYEPALIDQVQNNFTECKIEPTDALDGHPYEFVIPDEANSFLMLNTLTLYAKFKLTKADGDDVSATDGNRVTVCNNFLSSMWSSITLKVNDSTIGLASGKEIGYKSYIETILSYEDEFRQHIYTSLFNSDSAGKHELMGMPGDDDINTGFTRRFWKTSNSREAEVCGPVCVDFLRADNHLAPGNTLTLTFERAEDKFCLISPEGDGYKTEILDLAIYCRRVQLDPRVMGKILDPLKHQRYLTSYSELKAISLIRGVRSISEKIIDDELIPKQIIVAMVDSQAREGSYASNPFNLKHYGINSISLLVNGVPIPAMPLTPDFDGGLYMREYYQLFANTGKMQTASRGLIISPEKFAAGYTIFPFDLTPDRCNSFHSHAGKMGTVELNMAWKTPLTVGVDVLVYISSDQLVTIDPISKECKSSVF